MDKLLEFQKSHVESLVGSLMLNSRVLDASDTGTGKTFCILAACKIADLIPFVITPKSVIANWFKVSEHMGCELYGISNYELIQNCKYFNSLKKKVSADFVKVQELIVDSDKDNSSDSESDTNTMFKFKKINKTNKAKSNVDFQKKFRERALAKAIQGKKIEDKDLVDEQSDDEEEEIFSKKKIKYDYIWDDSKLPGNILFIFDEAHKCKNHKTNNGRLLYKLSKVPGVKIALLSATVVDKPEYFKLPGCVLGFYKDIGSGKHWLQKVSKGFDNPMEAVHKLIYPDYASRMRIVDLENEFPDNHIVAEKMDMANSAEIEAQYAIIQEAIQVLRSKEENSTSALAIILYARQQIELLKVPVFVKLTNELVSQGKHVALFVNFTDTLLSLGEHLGTKCFIYGEQKIEERDTNIQLFASNKEKIIICNIRAGGVGISLHDTDGNYPRVALISPTWSAQDLIQVLGRVHRANCKSPVEQKILFCNGTFEETIASIIQSKVKNIGFLNDGSTKSYKMENLIEAQTESNIQQVEIDEFTVEFERLERLNKKKLQLEKDLQKIVKEIINSEKKLVEKLVF
jgi:hypothetical protein